MKICEDILNTIFNKSVKGNLYDECPKKFGNASYRQIEVLKKNKYLIQADCYGHILVSTSLFDFRGWKIKAVENSRFNLWEITFYKEVHE